METIHNPTEPGAPVVFDNTVLPDKIELRNVCQSYDGGKTFVLQYVNLLIEDIPKEGESLAICGPSGCGKSTILRYIAGLQKPTSGDVLINAKPRTDADTVGMVFQQFSPLPWMTVLENVALGLEFHNVPLKERTEQAMEMLKLVGLEREAHKYAKDTQLSGGQLQRVALARSLVVNPTMVLLDEPNSALDVNTSFQMDLLIMEILERVQATIIYVTHNINSAVLFANHVYVMRKDPGRIVKHFPVPLGKHRDRQTKRDPLFIEIVNQIDDYMNSGVLVS